MNDFFNLMSFGCLCAHALTIVSAMQISRKYPDWKTSNSVKCGNIFRALSMVMAIAIAFFSTLGQNNNSWISFGVYLGISIAIWSWMVLVKWKKSYVEIETYDGIKEF